VGHAGPEEIDEWGILVALRLAARRALAGLGQPCGCVLLDGDHDWLTGPQASTSAPGSPWPLIPLDVEPTVRTVIGGDRRCAAVAAASILAKVERDALMVELGDRYREYGWHRNKGYASAEHVAALRERGPSPYHRHSWRLPGR
jgi:ribonuclease HII